MTAQKEETMELYLVMDGRAQWNTDEASVLESMGKSKPTIEDCQKRWGSMDAVLVRWFGWDGKYFTEEDIVCLIP